MTDWTPDYFEPIDFETAVRQAREAWKGGEFTELSGGGYIARVPWNAADRYVASPRLPEEKGFSGGFLGENLTLRSDHDSPEMKEWRARRKAEFKERWEAEGLDLWGRWPDEQPDVIAAKARAAREPLRKAYEEARDAYFAALAPGPESHADAPTP